MTRLINLLDLSRQELSELAQKFGEKPYRGSQIASWLFRRGLEDIEEMSDVSKKFRDQLKDHAQIILPELVDIKGSAKDGSRKILWRLHDEALVESVLIYEKDHLTLCLSSQVGCALGCSFCRTGTLGLTRNLSSGEILGQILGCRKILSEDEQLSNLVFMGMGDPLANIDQVLKSLHIICDSDLLAFAQRHVSISTVGLVPALAKLAQGPRVGLTISLTAATDELRNQLMPINKVYPLDTLKKALAAYPLYSGRRLTIAYVLLGGVNDSLQNARDLSRFLTGLKVKINLIPFNPWPQSPYRAPKTDSIEAFKNILTDKNYTVMVRYSKGQKQGAACGQLAAER